jgi:outer membrane protein TolC
VRAVLLVALLLFSLHVGIAPAAAQVQGSPRGPATTTVVSQAAGGNQIGPFAGGVPSGTATSDPIALSALDAINRALEHNLGVLISQEDIEQARGARWTALSDLLPNASARLSENRQKVNLAVFGFPLPPGVPPVVGPFNVFDARLFVSQSVLDLTAINDARAAAHDVSAARYSYQSARDLVVLVAANLYLQTVAAAARADSARAQLQTAQALYNQAVDLRQGGLVAGIDVLRAQVQLSTEQQRATATANDFEKSKLALARVIGLPVGQPFTLSDQLPSTPVPDMTLEQALDRAYKSRPDYQAVRERVAAAEASRAAELGKALPSAKVTADYGAVGLSPSDAKETYSVVGALNVPIFQGNRVHGRLIAADAELRNRRAEAEDLKAGIYYEVRSAFLDLRASAEQLDVATKARDLAGAELAAARDRFAAGVANNIEVTQGQQSVALASEQYIGALYSYNVSKAVLARALGVAEQAVRQYLGGSR